MKYLRALAALPLFTAACCVPVPEPEPSPIPAATQAPVPARAAPQPIAQPTYDNWLDAPQTEGDWTYGQDPDETMAVFAQSGTENTAPFIIRCDVMQRTISLARRGTNAASTPMRIRTETAQRLLIAQPVPGQRALVAATVPANDRLLDAIALSRGRFAVETGGLETLYLPAWPEITRVVEDCR
ncbi:hypothetical protein [Pontixanthobacter luteolus]|uniref:hypothetical protein n=1 Tax=Pontixanthobacter luteolus TaxID=295089 RepID=UPI002304941B|nr:hypothetical protein [Pontixanthobacter luteolus]